MASFLTKLAAKVAAAAPRGGDAPRPSLSSLVAAVRGAAPVPASARRPVPLEAPIVLVSCSDTKIATHGRLVAAADLYASPLFRKSLAHARAITSEDRIRILSARHGLLRTTDKITSYDFTLQQLSERERDDWGERVHGKLRSQFGDDPRDLILLAGTEYVSALRGLTNRYRNDRLPWTIDLPFGAAKGERMSIGQRLRWLNDQAYERGEAPPGAPKRGAAKSLESLTTSVVAAAGPGPEWSRRPVQNATPAARPHAGTATPPQAAAKSLASLAATVVAAATVRASSTKPTPAARPAARPVAGAAAPTRADASSLASLAATVVAASPSAPAPASTRAGAPSVRAGTRISYLGDTANPPSEGTVTRVDGAYFWGRLDNGRTLVQQPIALLSTPRWRVLVGAPSASVREPGSAAPTSLAAVAAAVASVAPVPSRRAPTSLKVEDLDQGWDSPPTQRAPVSVTPVLTYLTGDRVRFIAGPYAGRTGSVARAPGQFTDYRHVLLDMRPRERTEKTPFVPLADLELTGSPPMLASPTASAARGIVTAFREGLDDALARSSGTADPQPPPGESLARIFHLGREAEKAGALWKSPAQWVSWSQAVQAARKDNGDLAAFHAGRALAVSDWRDRGRALLDELRGASERAPGTASTLEPQELAELAEVLTRGGYDPADAARLQAEGMGPEELHERMKVRQGAVGSLESTHGLLQREVPAATSPAPNSVSTQHPFADWMQPGARVYNRGHTGHPPMYGRITRTWTDAWSNNVTIAWDDAGTDTLTTASFYPGPMSAARVVHIEDSPAPAAQRGDLIAEARQLGAHPPRDPATRDRLALPQQPTIASIEDLVALPVGTMLRLIRTPQGAMSSRRELIGVDSDELRLRVADPTDKDHNKIDHQALKNTLVEPRPKGFALLRQDRNKKQPPWVEAEYVLDEAGGPLSIGTLRAALDRHERAETAAARQTRTAQTTEWLHDARSEYQRASTPTEQVSTLRDLEDAQALHTATSLRELHPPRLARLIEATRDNDAYEDLHALLVDAGERGAYGVPSTQFALFQREAAAIGTELDRIGKGRIDPIRERIRRAISMVRHARGFGPELTWATTALREALDARKTARAGQAAGSTPTEQAAVAVVEHRAEALSQRLAEKAPCATDEGVLAATLGAYRTTAEIATLLGCDVAAVGEVLAQLYERHQLRKTFTKNKPERWGHDVPPWKEDWAVHRDGDRLYGDSSFLNAVKQLPHFVLRHLGFGEFTLDTPKGEVAFNRFAGVDFPGQTGRSHLLEGKPEALALLLEEMHVEERLSDEATATATLGGVSDQAVLAAASGADVPVEAVEAGFTRRGFRHTHQITVSRPPPSDYSDTFRATPPKDVDVQAWAVDEVKRRRGDRDWLVTVSVGEAAPGAARTGAVPSMQLSPIDAVAALKRTPVSTKLLPADAAPTALPEATATHLLEKVYTEGTPEEFEQKKSRTEANLAAMQLAATLRHAPRQPTPSELLVLGSYSGWGGLSIQEAASRFPADFPRPETRGLIHEYYTPARVCAEVARVLQPLLPALATAGGGTLAALEPSAGIGRFIRACEGPGFEAVTWHAVEYSAVSAALLRAMRPELDLFEGPFERWISEHEDEYAGRLQLVVSNPPYGKRGAAEVEDTNVAYRTKRADTYFLRRGLDLLAKDGIGVYLIPLGFLSGTGEEAVSLRADVLRRHHVACAYRLPSDLFPQALVTVDLIFFRARGGVLADVDATDAGILYGKYFLENPTHVLGTVKEGGGRYGTGYEVVGEFTTLPDFRERPVCSTCLHTPFMPAKAPAKAKGKASALMGLASRLQAASGLGTRLSKVLAGIAAQESELPFLAWEELHRALREWSAAHGAPSLDKDLLTLAKDGQDPGAQKFLTAFARGSTDLVQALQIRPTWTPRYTGAAGDVVAHAEFRYRQRRKLSRGDVAEADVRKLFAAGWAEDEPGEFVPPDVYYSGDLWPKYDRARVRAEAGSAQAGAQMTQLLAIIKPSLFDDIGGVSPQQGWIPLHLIEGWVQSISKSGQVQLERKDGLVQIVGTSYDELEGGWRHDVANVVGWINHDRALFRPKKQPADEGSMDMARLRVAREWEQAFRAWCSAEDARRITIEQAYQRSFQGYHPSKYSVDPLPLARWGKAVQLRPHQNAGARRVLANRGGLIAFDVGVGKTYTGCAILAAARQEGWAKRPVILVPNSIVWNWVAELARALPDYRVGVIGANRRTIKQGSKAGYQTSETDTPEERAEKWTRFQAGEFDVILVTYSSLPRTQLGDQDIIAYVDATSAVKRQLALRHRNAWKASGAGNHAKRKKATKLTERQEAILDEGTAGWVAEKLELPATWQYDPGISWNDLGIDLLIVDEAQNYKNLYLPEAREYGVPKFMGAAGEGSNRAWQLDFRAMTVRKRSGGAGVVLLSATPAKNSPLEFYNLIQYVDHDAFARLGILDPEQFIDRYCKILTREVVTMNATVEQAAACVGFQELHELREIIFRYGEFVTGDDVEKAGSQARSLAWRTLVDEHGSSVEEIARVWGWGKTDVEKGILVGRGQVPVERPDDAPGAVEDVEVPRAKSDRRRASLAAQVLANGRTWLQLLESICVRVGVPLAIGLDDGLKLPKPWVRRIELEGNEIQTAKRNAYKEGIEAKLENPGSSKSKSLLGMLASLSLVGIHPALDERREVANDDGEITSEPIWTWETAEDISTPHSPKLDAVAAEIMKRPGCGHIVFVENIAVHVWLRMVLIEAGMPRERIAILNAASGNPNRSPADRQRIAQEFNGSPAVPGTDGALGEPEILPKYDVILANQVAYEGINLQTRTCAVHHVDMPWEPATLQQRNGRAWRQGNEFLAIQIIYYMARCFPDGMKFNMIQGKRGWMADLIESQARETNNPGAQMDVGPEEVLAMLACDATVVRAMFAALREKAAAEARVKQADAASTSLRGAVSRFQRAADMRNPVEAARLRSEAQQRIDDLQHVDPKAWPWAEWAKQARDHAMMVPEKGGSPVYETLRTATPDLRDPSVLNYDEFGKIHWGTGIALRTSGNVKWQPLTLQQVVALNLQPESVTSTWPPDDEARMTEAMRGAFGQLRNPSQVLKAWQVLNWKDATDSFQEWAWRLFGGQITLALREHVGSTHWIKDFHVPVMRGGALDVGLLRPFDSIVALSPTGWEDFLALASVSTVGSDALDGAARFWWGKSLPRDLLSKATPEQEAARAGALQRAKERARIEREQAEREAAEAAERERLEAAEEEERVRREAAKRALEREERMERDRVARQAREQEERERIQRERAERAEREARELVANPHATFRVTGNTFPRRRELGAIPGARFDGITRVWVVPLAFAAEARRIMGQD